jgi:DNA-binding transcriptional LysR family regulator
VLRILDEIEQAETLLSHSRREVSGLLRVTAPGEFGRQHIVPIVADFQRQHPQLAVQLDLSDAVVNLLESGHDLAIRFGSLEDSTLVARRLAPNYRVACAAPAYLAQYGTRAIRRN